MASTEHCLPFPGGRIQYFIIKFDLALDFSEVPFSGLGMFPAGQNLLRIFVGLYFSLLILLFSVIPFHLVPVLVNRKSKPRLSFSCCVLTTQSTSVTTECLRTSTTSKQADMGWESSNSVHFWHYVDRVRSHRSNAQSHRTAFASDHVARPALWNIRVTAIWVSHCFLLEFD